MTVSNNICLSYDEYVLLMCLFGAKHIYGTFLEDKYINITPEIAEQMWERCKDSLFQKKYIEVKEKGIDFDIALYYLLNACIKSTKTVTVQISEKDTKIFDCTFYSANGSTVVCVLNDESNNVLSLYVKSQDRVYIDICSYISKDCDYTRSTGDIQLEFTEHEYFSMIANINMHNLEKVYSMISSDVEKSIADDLICALGNNNRTLTITEYSDNGDELCAFIMGRQLYWNISYGESDNIIFQALGVNDVEQFLKRYFGLGGED